MYKLSNIYYLYFDVRFDRDAFLNIYKWNLSLTLLLNNSFTI